MSYSISASNDIIWPTKSIGNDYMPIAYQPIGDMEVNLKLGHVYRGATRYLKAFNEEKQRKNPAYQQGVFNKARGYQNNIRSFMEYSYSLDPTFRKDAPALTTTTGFYNQVYGNQLFSQINNEQNAWGILRKVPWDRSGWRTIEAAGATSGGGQSESGAVPATIKPTIGTVSTKPKVVATGYNVSALQQGLSLDGGDDAITNTMDAMRQYAAIEHGKLINRMLLTDVDTLASNNIESLDRVVSSYSEVTNCGITANDSDIYSKDRDAGATVYDGYVNHNSGTDRAFSLSLIDSLFTNCMPYLQNPADYNAYILLTGYDTYKEITQHLSEKLRFAQYPTGNFMPSVNGVSALQPGVDGGFVVALYNGVPIFVSNDVPQDTISRIYLLNLNYTFIKVLMPTMYFQTGLLSNGDPFGIDFLGDEGLFVTMAELISTNMRVNGKIRDLQTA
ncbi:MAG TPA: hypothetical protein VKN14_05505 [Flavobacteriaceae bacterium]|nr:hypothetical protein [Flavobacteriaceae bacterium]